MWNMLLILFSFMFEFGNDPVDNVEKKKDNLQQSRSALTTSDAD